jgi:flagella basal body P-ring formation protein FlgA
MPPGLPIWGSTRMGLRCTQGAKLWNVSIPITVSVYTQATVLKTALAAGTVLDGSQLAQAEVDIAAAPGAAVSDPMLAVGRTLGRSVAAGATLRQTDLKARQYFAAGETVRVVALGPGWQVVTEGQAIGAGIEGQMVRVRTEAGRLLTARPTGDRQVEIAL